MTIHTEEGLRVALHGAPAPDLHGVDVSAVMRRGRQRRLAQRSGVAMLVVLLLAGGAVGAAVLADGARKSAVPASSHDELLATWAACLNAQNVPGVLTVVVAGDEKSEVQFLGDRHARQMGQPAPRPTLSDDDVRRVGGAELWRSALEACTPAEPALIKEVEARWGDVTARPAAEKRWMRSMDQYTETYHACLRMHGVVIPVQPASDAPIEDQRAYAEQHVIMYKQGLKSGCPYDPPRAPAR